VGGNDYSDGNVSDGTAYEYKIVKTTTSSAGYIGWGYIYAGIRAPAIQSRGRIILIVDNRFSGSLPAELERLRQDLIGDGWLVLRHDVSPGDSVQSVKAIIKSDYDADRANTKAVFLFGHVPVPYSGNIFPDGHPQHQGAWPADTYYGDMNGTWTDNTVDTRIMNPP